MSAPYNSVETVEAMRQFIKFWRTEGASVGLVPTMGALHEGHLSLIKAALKECDRVIVSIFVNPKQFGENEDFSTYPRTLEEDSAKIQKAGAHLLFHPSVEEMYGPDGAITKVTVEGEGQILEGAFRPGFFDGVATVVTKLLLQAMPDKAFFGEKDFQQLSIIKRFVEDLNIPVEIAGVATVREPDGLALSSRNAYLSDYERALAPILHKTLTEISQRFEKGEPAQDLIDWGKTVLLDTGFETVDYIEIRKADRLADPALQSQPKRVLAAAKLGKARLIDNVD